MPPRKYPSSHIVASLFLRCLQRIFHNVCNGVFADSMLLTVFRLNPIGKLLGPFTGITSGAATGNILTIDNPCIIDDVLPSCHRSPMAI